MEGWLDEELRAAGVQAPQGFAYQGHSLRSGGTSAMAAIGVERHIYIWLGGWVRGSDVVDRLYLAYFYGITGYPGKLRIPPPRRLVSHPPGTL